jgi:hypothetical protein
MIASPKKEKTDNDFFHSEQDLSETMRVKRECTPVMQVNKKVTLENTWAMSEL